MRNPIRRHGQAINSRGNMNRNTRRQEGTIRKTRTRTRREKRSDEKPD